ncbi:MAG TPA: tetratricopeptide repeat protein, partial [Thermoanaerobaculia bacterium]
MSRPLTIAILALWKGLSQKEIGAAIRMPQKKVSFYLRRKELADRVYERLLAGVRARPVEVSLVTGCLEALAALDGPGDLTPEERDEVERATLEGTRLLRSALSEAARRSRSAPPADCYPEPEDVEPARWHAGQLWERIRSFPEDYQSAVVRAARELRTWALVERVCEESIAQASRDLNATAALTRLAREIAEWVEGPEEWRLRLQGFAGLHSANYLRVAGELQASEAAFEQAKRLWNQGSDPAEILDPGRPFDLEASLCRAQRRFEEALALLDQAERVGRGRARILVNKGFTLEVMGHYEQALEVLREAGSLVDRDRAPRLWYNQRFNIAVNLCHLGRFSEAGDLLQQVREVATGLGDRIFLNRVTWLAGRVAAGQGRVEEAVAQLQSAHRGFLAQDMGFDVSLALLEEAALRLDQGQAREVRALVRDLPQVFRSKGVHREAVAALRLFQEAAERETATAELARRV